MRIFSVSEFIDHINDIFALEETVIEGEVSDFKISQGKWVFFDLKDDRSKIDCFLTVFQLKGIPLEDGMKLRVTGYPKIYAKTGRFSLVVAYLELAGEGSIKRAFELTKARLEKEGLFASERKRPLPRFPKTIGLITSPEAAAYSDFVKILNERWGGIKIYLAGVSVQGAEAVPSIVGAFDHFAKYHSDLGIELIVLTRGGGSLEDLAAFNSEEVARAIFSARVPVVAGLGHERDVTIADLVADYRASTPSAAAEIIVPSRREVAAAIANNIRIIDFSFGRALQENQEGLSYLVNGLFGLWGKRIERFDLLVKKLAFELGRFKDSIRVREGEVAGKAHSVRSNLEHLRRSLDVELGAKVKILESLDPEKVLARGYSIVFSGKKVVKNSADLIRGQTVSVKLHRGSFGAEVISLDS